MSKRMINVMMTVVLCAAMAQAGIRADLSGDAVVDFATTMDMPFMTVGNPGNAPDGTGYGGVDYVYNIGKFEVTAGQYAEFLNAVAATDAYGLYNAKMDSWADGCQITQNGSSGSYTYDFSGRPSGNESDWDERPVNYVDWGDAARFANWLTNGMPTGSQDLTTTEDGSYFLNGATSDAALLVVTREPDARYAIPSEDEWVKAAYHKNDGVTGNYFGYPTSSDALPSNDLIDPDPGNNANFYPDLYDEDLTIGGPYYRTEVGEFENSASPYGTFDMGGNVWEWDEVVFDGGRAFRGGAWGYGDEYLHQSHRNDYGTLPPTYAKSYTGFRISEVPEPATMGLLALGGLGALRRRRS